MEHAIGTRITLEVVETDWVTCKGCFFSDLDLDFCQQVKCYEHKRTDHKNIIYKEIKED